MPETKIPAYFRQVCEATADALQRLGVQLNPEQVAELYETPNRKGFGDSALHKNRGGASDKAWTKIVDAQAKKDRDLMDLREKLRAEYNEKVAKGEIRPPSHMERLISTAKGNPDREDVQAARRLLPKRGISWDK